MASTSRTYERDPERRHDSDKHYDQSQSAQESNQIPKFRDSSGPLFSMYATIAEQEDNKTAERWQKDVDGILIFTGFFSVAVAVLLVMSVQDLRSNSQDTSAFYLANIYQTLANPNATVPRTSIPSAVAIPPPFSPPTYAVWVNSLWFLSFVISLTCGLLATMLRQWSHRYVGITQPPQYSLEKRARMRAFFSNGVEKMRVPLAVETLPALLHLSLFLFFAGVLIFSFNVNRTVFIPITSWIALLLLMYGSITVMPIFQHNSPYYAPFSSIAWSLYTRIQHGLFAILVSIMRGITSYRYYFLFREFRDRYHRWKSMDIGKAAEETAMKLSSEFDLHILDWTLSALVDDDSLGNYLRTIPGFVNSNMVKIRKSDIPHVRFNRFWEASCGYLRRTLSINRDHEAATKVDRLVICMNAMNVIPCPPPALEFIYNIIDERLGQVPLSIETGIALARHCTNNKGPISQHVEYCIAKILTNASPQELDHRWVVLRDLSNIAPVRDSVLLSTLIRETRQVIVGSDSSNPDILSALPEFDINNAVPKLQNEFCALWNEVLRKSKSDGHLSTAVKVLCAIRQVYIALHQGTPAAPTAFNETTDDLYGVLLWPSSYPLCNIAAHHSNLTVPHHPHHPSRLEAQPIPGGSTTPHQTEEANITPGLLSSAHHAPPVRATPRLTTDPTSNIGRNDEPTPDIPRAIAQVGEISHTPTATLPGFPHPHPVPVTVAPSTVPPPSAVPVEKSDSNMRQDSIAPHALSDITQVSSQPTQIHYSIPSAGVALQASEELTDIPPTSTTVSDPQSSLNVMVPPPSSVILPPSVESALVRPDHHLSRLPGPLSSTLPTVHSDVHVTTNIGALGSSEHHETHDPNPLTPTGPSIHVQQSRPSTPEA